MACPLLPTGSKYASRLLAATLLVLLSATQAVALGVKEYTCLVPMRDGVCLATDVYLPRTPRRGCHPALLIRTSNGRQEIKKLQARYVLHQGYALVVQDIRQPYQPGTGGFLFLSDGWGDLRDGHDTIRWVASQGWCNGRVATWGPSEMGFLQNLAAPDAPEALRAQHVMMAFSNMYAQTVYQGGAFRKELVEGWLRGRPCADRMLAEILAHPNYDELWMRLNPEAQAARVNTPTVFWGGWHDAFLEGAIGSFTSIQHQGGPRARGNCRLILGPWSHEDLQWLIDPRKNGGVPQAGNAVRWFNYWVKGCASGVPCDQPVHYYVMGACEAGAPGNCWRAAPDWPLPTAATPFYLHGDHALRPLPSSAADSALTYRYDPRNPVPTLGGNNLKIAAGPQDQRSVESREDVLLFTGDVLADPLEATGRVLAKLHVSSDCPDTDFTVKLTDVYPDGRSCLVADGILRARFHESFQRPKLLEPGKVYAMNVDLGSTSYVFNRGHRIRVAVSSSNSPRFEPNPNTGRPAGQAEPRTAANTVYLSKDKPSQVILPISPSPAGRGPG